MAEAKFIDQPGGRVWVAEAPVWGDGTVTPERSLLVGIPIQSIIARGSRGQRWLIGQMYGVVGTGLIMTEHLFKGLRRMMMTDNSHDAAREMYAASWKAPRDAYLAGEEHAAYLEYQNAPPGKVFVVYISSNSMLRDFPEIWGWAEHWAWIAEDPNESGAPVDWESRYDQRIWSQRGAG